MRPICFAWRPATAPRSLPRGGRDEESVALADRRKPRGSEAHARRELLSRHLARRYVFAVSEARIEAPEAGVDELVLLGDPAVKDNAWSPEDVAKAAVPLEEARICQRADWGDRG
jgi:hypothetical protein